MGRDRKRVLICAAISIVLTITGTLVMDWYRVAFDATDGGFGKISIAIDLRSLHTCTAIRVCTTAPLGPLPGMFPTLAAVTLWSSLAFLALVAFQAGIRLLTGNANDSLAKFGYMVALTAISIAFATAYLFGPETEGPVVGMVAELGLSLHRTWGPLTLIVGLVAGFATLYMAVAPAPPELGDSYKPVTLVLQPIADEPSDMPSDSLPMAARTATKPMRPSGTRLGPTPPPTGQPSRPARPPSGPLPLIGPATVTSEIQIVGDLLEAPLISDRETIRSQPLAEPEVRQPITRREGPAPLGRPLATGREDNGPLAAKREVVALPPARREPAGALPGARRETTSASPAAKHKATSAIPGAKRETTGVTPAAKRETTGLTPAARRETTGVTPAARRETTGVTPAARRETTGVTPAPRRETTGVTPSARRETTGVTPAPRRETTSVTSSARRETTGVTPAPRRETTTGGSPAVARTQSAPIPEHLRNRLQYIAITAEVTAGGIDARREDGTSRLVLWRDVVGVVARRMPSVYDGITFVDVVSTAGSTLRIVPWTRLTGDVIDGEGDERPRGVIELIIARCPGAKLDPATRQFLETGLAAQLRDVETLQAHDARLA